eukprot:m.248072 g.248072  ORF g.248072 m.248072 type:complete len:1635 (+) comp26663_c1_seq18:689-5593(+)
MGVPRLFRLLCERYPLILRDVSDPPLPEFDNLYLDFNGIIHVCTHNNEASTRKTEQEMMLAIFSYVQTLFDIVQPKRLLFIAIDGVAPRAKMNQQRQRRFRAAKLRQDMANSENSTLDEPEEDTSPPFDSNCITPGTVFMEQLNDHLAYFVQRKIHEDLAWQNIDVIVSGHRVPGEGEHKIMEFIRSLKSQPNYNPNTRHCLHGLDADLIMLALSTHEPHFCILREKMIMRGRSKVLNDSDAKEVSFQATDERQFLHIGLLREYINKDFARLDGPATHPVPADHLERTIDDFVFLCFFLGNDFLPHLMAADLDEGGLADTVDLYRKLKKTHGDYLVDAASATIHLPFLEEIFANMALKEDAIFQALANTKKPSTSEPTLTQPSTAQPNPTPAQAPAVLPPPPSAWQKEPTNNAGAGPLEPTRAEPKTAVPASAPSIPKDPAIVAAGPVTQPASSKTPQQQQLLNLLQNAQAKSSSAPFPQPPTATLASGPSCFSPAHAQELQALQEQLCQAQAHASILQQQSSAATARAVHLRTMLLQHDTHIQFMVQRQAPFPEVQQQKQMYQQGQMELDQVSRHQDALLQEHNRIGAHINALLLRISQLNTMQKATPETAPTLPGPSATPPQPKSHTASTQNQQPQSPPETSSPKLQNPTPSQKPVSETETKDPVQLFLHPAERQLGTARRPDQAPVSFKSRKGLRLFGVDPKKFMTVVHSRNPVSMSELEEDDGEDDDDEDDEDDDDGADDDATNDIDDHANCESDQNRTEAVQKTKADGSVKQAKEIPITATEPDSEKSTKANNINNDNTIKADTESHKKSQQNIATETPLDGHTLPTESNVSQLKEKLSKSKPKQSSNRGSTKETVVKTPAQYYDVKFNGMKIGSPEHRSLCRVYLEGLFWTLHYYFQGMKSWSWFYSFFGAPLASDLKNLTQLSQEIKLELGAPLTPFQQLLGVLPAESRYLLPDCLGSLMVNELKEFYPQEYDFIFDKKGREWRDIALIPFVDEKKLRSAYDECLETHELSSAEKNRNTLRPARLYVHSKEQPIRNESSLPELQSLMVQCGSKSFQPWPLKHGFSPKLCDGCWTGQVLPPPSFPTTEFLQTKQELKQVGVRVVGSRSRNASLLLHLRPNVQPNVDRKEHEEIQTRAKALASRFVEHTCYTGYPFPVESLVEAVMTSVGCWELSRKGNLVQTKLDFNWQDMVTTLRDDLLITKGIDVGRIDILLQVRPLEGMVMGNDGSVSKHFGQKSHIIPVQAIPAQAPRPDPRYLEQKAPSLRERYQAGMPAICLDADKFGFPCNILEVKEGHSLRCRIKISSVLSSNLQSRLENLGRHYATSDERYFSARDTAQRIGTSTFALSRLAGSITVELDRRSHVHIGLCLKFQRRGLMVAGYTRRIPHPRREGAFAWEFSGQAVTVLSRFRSAFPDLFRAIEADPGQDIFPLEKVFLGEGGKTVEKPAARLEEVLQWLRECDSASLPLSPCDSRSLPLKSLRAMEKSLDQILSSEPTTTTEAEVNASALLLPLNHHAPICEGKFNPGDRVVNTRASGSVPFGLQGILVSTYQGEGEVLFDQTFLAGGTLRGRCAKARAFTVPLWALVNLTTREKAIKKKKNQKKKKGGGAANTSGGGGAGNRFSLLDC